MRRLKTRTFTVQLDAHVVEAFEEALVIESLSREQVVKQVIEEWVEDLSPDYNDYAVVQLREECDELPDLGCRCEVLSRLPAPVQS